MLSTVPWHREKDAGRSVDHKSQTSFSFLHDEKLYTFIQEYTDSRKLSYSKSQEIRLINRRYLI